MSEFFEQLNSSATLVPPSVEDKEWFSSDGSTATRPVPGGANSARPRSAALALVLRRRQTSNSLDKSGRVDILFIKRAVNPRDKWSGHVALPGGRQEVGESDLQTAVRECKEEVGVELVSSRFTLMGRLRDRLTTTKKRKGSLTVSCFVFMQNDSSEISVSIQRSEVAHAWWVDMAHFYPKSDPCEVCFATSSMWRGSSRAHWKALLWLTRTEHLFIPCFHLPRPPLPSSASSPTAASPEPLTVVKTGAKATCVVDPHAGDTFVLWGLTFGVVSDLVAAAGGRRFAAEHPPYFRFHNLAADFALRLYYTLDSWDFCVIQAFVRERLTLPQLRR